MLAQPIPAAGVEPLRERFEVVVGGPRPDFAELKQAVAGAAALVADPTIRVDAELLDAAGPQLAIVANFAVGYDNVDLEACRERGIVVTNTPDVLTNATAELTIALMLAAARRLGEAERLLRARRWDGWEPLGLLGRELAESTVGLVGLGRIGGRVAELLNAFGCRQLYSSRNRRPELEQRLALERLPFAELVAASDVVSLHLPLTPETQHVVDASALARFKRGSILVNTARGGLVDTAALVDALRSGPLEAAALDVYEDEPRVAPALLDLDNVVLSPHIGSATQRARDGMARLVADNVISVLEGRPPASPITR